MRQLKLAFRTLFRTPFVTTVAILSLALGIGANAAIYSLFDQMLLRPLPVHDPAQLVDLSAPGPKPGSTSCNQAGSCEDVFSLPMFLAVSACDGKKEKSSKPAGAAQLFTVEVMPVQPKPLQETLAAAHVERLR